MRIRDLLDDNARQQRPQVDTFSLCAGESAARDRERVFQEQRHLVELAGIAVAPCILRVENVCLSGYAGSHSLATGTTRMTHLGSRAAKLVALR
jgi:hypothetical protein